MATETTHPEPLTDKERDEYSVAINHWHRTGAPEKAAVLRECLEQDRKAPSNLVYFGDVRPETSVDPSTLEAPPRAGPGADTETWREFARKTTDLEPEIIDKMPRKDIISMLEAKKVIPKAEKK